MRLPMTVMKRPSGGSPSSIRRAVRKLSTISPATISSTSSNRYPISFFLVGTLGSGLVDSRQQSPVVHRHQAFQPGQDQLILADADPLPVTANAVQHDLRRLARWPAPLLPGPAHALLPFRPAQPLRITGTGADGPGNATGVHHGIPYRPAAKLQTQGVGEAPDGKLAGPVGS